VITGALQQLMQECSSNKPASVGSLRLSEAQGAFERGGQLWMQALAFA
jgi:hypothetical protein